MGSPLIHEATDLPHPHLISGWRLFRAPAVFHNLQAPEWKARVPLYLMP
jgi:hypothetical protein